LFIFFLRWLLAAACCCTTTTICKLKSEFI